MSLVSLSSLPETIDGYEISVEHGMLFLSRPGWSSSEGIYYPDPTYLPPRHKTAELYLMNFGAYGEPRVLVWAESFEKALEEGAAAAKEINPYAFTEIDEGDIKAGKKEISDETGRPVADISDEEAFDHMTTDLTYTESGYLMDWGGGEAGDELRAVAEKISEALEE